MLPCAGRAAADGAEVRFLPILRAWCGDEVMVVRGGRLSRASELDLHLKVVHVEKSWDPGILGCAGVFATFERHVSATFPRLYPPGVSDSWVSVEQHSNLRRLVISFPHLSFSKQSRSPNLSFSPDARADLRTGNGCVVTRLTTANWGVFIRHIVCAHTTAWHSSPR